MQNYLNNHTTERKAAPDIQELAWHIQLDLDVLLLNINILWNIDIRQDYSVARLDQDKNKTTPYVLTEIKHEHC